MKRIKCYDKNGDSINHLIQWDKNQMVYIDDLEDGIIPEAHFATETKQDEARIYLNATKEETINGSKKIKIIIPNDLLLESTKLYIFLYYSDGKAIENMATTEYFVELPIISKPRPSDQVYEDNLTFISMSILQDAFDKLRVNGNATFVEKSRTNGNINVNGSDIVVYTHPSGTNPHGTTAKDLGLDTDNLKKILRDIFYPVGTIYESVKPTNPSEFIGGTWVSWGAGKVSVGVDVDQTEFSTVEKTGGEKSHILTSAEMPSHSHNFVGDTVASGTQSANHTHSIPSLSGTAATKTLKGGVLDFATQSETGLAYEGICAVYPDKRGDHRYGGGSLKTNSSGDTLSIDATHSHTVTTNTNTTGSNSANHTHSVTVSGDIENAGSGVAHNNLQPYITSYKWKRTA